MTTTRFLLDPDALENCARDVRTVYEREFLEALNGLQTIQNQMPGLWQAQAQRAFVSQFGNWSGALADLGRNLILIEAFLYTVADEYRKRDQERTLALDKVGIELPHGSGAGSSPQPGTNEPLDKGQQPQSPTSPAPMPSGSTYTVKPAPVPPQAAPAAGAPPSATSVVNGTLYTVRAGDDLLSIADRHRVSLGDLVRANLLSGRITSSLIYPGQELIIPSGPVAAPPAVERTLGAPLSDPREMMAGASGPIYYTDFPNYNSDDPRHGVPGSPILDGASRVTDALTSGRNRYGDVHLTARYQAFENGVQINEFFVQNSLYYRTESGYITTPGMTYAIYSVSVTNGGETVLLSIDEGAALPSGHGTGRVSGENTVYFIDDQPIRITIQGRVIPPDLIHDSAQIAEPIEIVIYPPNR